MSIPDNLLYNRTHEWVREDGDHVVVGISHYAQEQLGEVVYVELPAEGDAIDAGQELGTLESVKAVSEFNAPVAGTVVAVNERLQDEPNLINDDPYGDGWLVRLEGAPGDDLLDAAAYGKLIEEEGD